MRPSELDTRPVEALVPYARNSRTHSDDQVAQIAASIREFGFTNPVLIDADGGIIAGHGRVLAAKRLGLQAVPVLVLDHLTAQQRRAYVIADNKLALNAGWDEDVLRAEVDALGADFDLDLLGFSDDELQALLNPPSRSEVDPDEVPEEPATPATQPGDVWLMGGHRIICGDSTDAATVEALLKGAKPHLMVTDPPYGVEYDANWRNEADRANGKAYGASDGKADWTKVWELFPGDVAYAWHAGRHASVVQSSLEVAGFEMRSQIIWAKTRLIISRGDYHWQHEPCWYAVRKGKKGHWAGSRSQTTLWTIEHAKSETGHSTQKPVECMKRPIENNSKPGDAVYEPFRGSGTTIIAAEMTGRRCYAIELNPAYVDVAVRRWEDFAGRVATLEATGQTFREVSEERRLAALAA
jgi:DNA modification methylase